MNKPHNNMKNRQRGRNGGKPRPGGGGGGGGGGRNPNFDGGNNNGRMRGNAQQLMEKFLAMARDATSSGDRVLAENYFQHADHYYRVLNARFEQQNGQPNQNGQNGQRFQGDTQGDNQGDNQGNQGGYNQNRGDGGNQGSQGYQGHQNSGNQQPRHYNQQDAGSSGNPGGQQPAQQQDTPPPAAPPSAAEPEIGLPPGILGIAPELPPDAAPAAEGADGARPSPRPRRRGPRPADAGE
jgi:hypothetical protein